MFCSIHKGITKKFNFEKALDKSELPGYIRHYVLEDEQILVVYKTKRDHGVFTDKKIVLFDSFRKFGGKKQILTILYDAISTISITFKKDSAQLILLLNNGVFVYLNFVNVVPEDKVRLRILYTCMNRIISNQEPLKKDIKRLMKDDVSLENH